MDNVVFQIMQICDSNFPTGAFSHSFGLETYIQEGKIKNKQSFKYALQQYMASQFIFTDGLACRLSYEAIKSGNEQRLWEIDQSLFALCGSRETREGNQRIGRQFIKVMNELYPNDLLRNYEAKIKAKELSGHSSLVFAIGMEPLGIDVCTILSCYLYSTVSTLIQNGVRGIPLGQTDGQRILRELQSFILQQVENTLRASEDDFGGSVLGLEIAQMRHEQLSVRLFSS
ncbi:urease accessory protein UreF [Bacillus sp. DNRA2]|uniref:urease accessory protein UreF n=1 Tax=Bacillus sp. DNRA2 TaxID=2723053 RepID=UPI00145CFFA0|nr:urease accessory protein UreF [Bacillus sp. DNRA2]NMD71791.1 urease accessory protein UreF [Bacillus sp. DNRA2]